MRVCAGAEGIDKEGADPGPLLCGVLWHLPGAVRFSFVKIDLDGDQIDELISLEEYTLGDDDWDGTILDIFTMKDGQPVWLIAGAYRSNVDIFEDGVIRQYSSGGWDYIVEEYYKLRNGELTPIMVGTIEDGKYFFNGEECSKEDYYSFDAIDRYDPLWAFDLEKVVTVQP